MTIVSSPDDVQKIIAKLQYYCNDEKYSLSSAKTTLERGRGHCVESALVAASLMEQLGYLPFLLHFWAIPNANHGVYLFENAGNYFTFGKSRYPSLENKTDLNLSDLIRNYDTAFREIDRELLTVSKVDLRECQFDWRKSKEDIATPFNDFLSKEGVSNKKVWTSICRVP